MAQMSLEQSINCNFITPGLAQAALVRINFAILKAVVLSTITADPRHLRSLLSPGALRLSGDFDAAVYGQHHPNLGLLGFGCK